MVCSLFSTNLKNTLSNSQQMVYVVEKFLQQQYPNLDKWHICNWGKTVGNATFCTLLRRVSTNTNSCVWTPESQQIIEKKDKYLGKTHGKVTFILFYWEICSSFPNNKDRNLSFWKVAKQEMCVCPLKPSN